LLCDEKTIAEHKYLLSLKDLNLSEKLEALIEAGVTSFKIEGRLKDMAYVQNVVSFYSKKLDSLNVRRPSSGKSVINFEPDLTKTFNRGFTSYFFDPKNPEKKLANTSKSFGEFIGKVISVNKNFICLDTKTDLQNGDGICFFTNQDELCGTNVNEVKENKIYLQNLQNIKVGQEIYRNHNALFLKTLKNTKIERKIEIELLLRTTETEVILEAKDEDENLVLAKINFEAKNVTQNTEVYDAIKTNLQKLGGTIFYSDKVTLDIKNNIFIPLSLIKQLRREIVEKLIKIRKENYQKQAGKLNKEYKINDLDFSTEIFYFLNQKTKQFWQKLKVKNLFLAPEGGGKLQDNLVMISKFCILKELDLCGSKQTYFLVDEKQKKYALEFDCEKCRMQIINF
jgi:putative protease